MNTLFYHKGFNILILPDCYLYKIIISNPDKNLEHRLECDRDSIELCKQFAQNYVDEVLIGSIE